MGKYSSHLSSHLSPVLVEPSFGGGPELLLVEPSFAGGPELLLVEPSFGGGIFQGYVGLDGVCSACFGCVGVVLNMSSTILDLGFEVGLIVAEPEAAGATGQSNASGGVSGLSVPVEAAFGGEAVCAAFGGEAAFGGVSGALEWSVFGGG